jgi:hypothetical protein
MNIIVITCYSCQERQGASANKLQVKAAKSFTLAGLARSKQDPINGGHGAQYLYRPPPAGAVVNTELFFKKREPVALQKMGNTGQTAALLQRKLLARF